MFQPLRPGPGGFSPSASAVCVGSGRFLVRAASGSRKFGSGAKI